MGLLMTLLTLPVSGPIRGALWVAEKIHEAAEDQRLDPGVLKRELAALEARLLAGEIDEDAYEAAEETLLDLLAEAERRR